LIKETFSPAPKAFGVAAHTSHRARHVNEVFIPIYNANYHFHGRSLLSRTKLKNGQQFLELRTQGKPSIKWDVATGAAL
jgi:hypothetical protein